MASFGHAPACEADVGEIESVAPQDPGRREAELKPQTWILAEENQLRKMFERRITSSGRTLRVCQDLIDEFRDSRVYHLPVIPRTAARPCWRLLASFFLA